MRLNTSCYMNSNTTASLMAFKYQMFMVNVHASVGPSSSIHVMISLLPDKTRRSYDDMLNGLDISLKNEILNFMQIIL